MQTDFVPNLSNSHVSKNKIIMLMLFIDLPLTWTTLLFCQKTSSSSSVQVSVC